ncbi:hypothetical protein [Pyramidobacter piscolens]|uniref:hypothetical protein n=1 Tax=Pyramidobacter piscolens TaxID=638849 RepID=UPI00266C0C17|nr:hypothetical protein [Pyramidobacter piscolens]
MDTVEICAVLGLVVCSSCGAAFYLYWKEARRHKAVRSFYERLLETERKRCRNAADELLKVAKSVVETERELQAAKREIERQRRHNAKLKKSMRHRHKINSTHRGRKNMAHKAHKTEMRRR